MKYSFHHILNKFAFVVAVCILTSAVFLSLLKGLTPLLSHYKGNVETWLSSKMHSTVYVGKIYAGWKGFEPVIKLQDVVILKEKTKKPQLSFKSLELGFDLWKSALKKRVEFGIVAARGTNIRLQQLSDGAIKLYGINAIKPFDLKGHNETGGYFLSELSTVPNISFRDVSVDVLLKDGTKISNSKIQLSVKNRGEHHKFSGKIKLDQKTPSQLSFFADVRGDLENKKNSRVKLYVKGKEIVLEQWLQQLVAKDDQLVRGSVTGQAWLLWQKGKLQSAQTKVYLSGFRIKEPDQKKFINIDSFSGNVDWHLVKDKGWLLSGDHLSILSQDQSTSNLKFSLQKNNNIQQENKYTLFVNHAPLQMASPLLHEIKNFPKNWLDKIDDRNPTGAIKNLLLQYTSPQDFSITTGFSKLSVQEYKKIPGINNLEGVVHITPTFGELDLDGSRIDITSKRFFNGSLPPLLIKGKVTWKQLKQDWNVEASQINLLNNDMSMYGRVSLQIPKDGESPILDLLMDANYVNAKDIDNYLPVGIMKPKLAHWLNKAFKAGTVEHSTLIVRGPIKYFPFDGNNEGVFVSDSELKNVTLNYKPDWPLATHLNGEVVFSGRHMNAKIDSGEMHNSTITGGKAYINYLGKGKSTDLTLNCSAVGRLSDSLRFLKQGPLRDKIGKKLSILGLTGKMDLNLDLKIPLGHKRKHVKVKGLVSTTDGQLKVPDWRLTLQNVKGGVHFTENSVFAKSIKADFLKKPVTLSLDTLNKTTKHSTLKVDFFGKMDAPTLQNGFHYPLLKRVAGAFSYNGTLRINSNDKTEDKLYLTTNLQGIKTQFPEPLYKKVNKKVKTKIAVSFKNRRPILMKFSYGKNVTGALNFKKTMGKLNFVSGNVHLGGGTAVYQKQRGLLVNGVLPSFQWSKWHPLISELKNKNAGLGNYLRGIDVQINILNIFNQNFFDVKAKLWPEGSKLFASFDGPGFVGGVNFPNKKEKAMLIRFKKLYLHGEDLAKKSSNVNPATLSPLDVAINDFRYNSKIFGSVRLLTTKTENGLGIEQLVINSKTSHLDAKGNWVKRITGPQTFLTGELDTVDLANLFSILGGSTKVNANDARLHFNLVWPSNPYDFKMSIMRGNLFLTTGKGVVFDIGQKASSELEMGRLLTLLSIQSLPRRLFFDFSDLTTKGFNFDSIKGNFELKDGDARTSNTQISGTVASLGVKGDIDFLGKELNLSMAVTPHLTSSLPVIVGLTGGPIAGVATWVASKIVSKAINKTSTRFYTVTGNWKKPFVNEIKH